MVDHISKPYMSSGEEVGLAGWREDMARAAQYENVHCKLSGLVTEVDPDHHNTPWAPETFRSRPPRDGTFDFETQTSF